MKKIFILAAIAALVSISASNASANNQFSMSDNDTVRIHPNRLDGYSQQVISMTTDAFCDTWNIVFGYPDGMAVKLVSGIAPLSGMTVDYTTYTGEWMTYDAALNVSAAYASVASTTSSVYGYHDYNEDGVYEPYGTVKWMPGTRPMFSLNFYIDPNFRKGWLTMDATFNSSMDSRGSILSNVRNYKKTWVYIGYQRGDVTGDEHINISDVMLLINYISGTTDFDEFALAAADYNDDGEVNISDVTALISFLKNK